MFELIFDKKAAHQLEKLPKVIRERIFYKIVQAKEDPFHFFIKLEGREDYKMRVGDYRVIADINLKERRIEVTKIGHRRDIYES